MYVNDYIVVFSLDFFLFYLRVIIFFVVWIVLS